MEIEVDNGTNRVADTPMTGTWIVATRSGGTCCATKHHRGAPIEAADGDE
jgi:hypothetical protein